MWSTTLAWMGKIRSTPWPKLTLRTVMLSPKPVLLRAITVPSKACRRSLSPSLIFTWTRMVSPGRKVGTASARLFLLMNFDNNAFCMKISLNFYHIRVRGDSARLPLPLVAARYVTGGSVAAGYVGGRHVTARYVTARCVTTRYVGGWHVPARYVTARCVAA